MDFSADRATVNPDRRAVLLSGNVRITCGRYRLNADRLRIDSVDGAIDVTGPAVVTLCPCPVAPISVAFDRARIEPPSDIILRAPKLRIGETTVFALPSAWLRGPDQVGLLVPRLAWRGADGLLVGPGVHLPLGASTRGPSSLQIYVSGYAKGGAEIDTKLTTPTSRTKLRFDHLHGDLVELGSRGFIDPEPGRTTVSWTGDLARGDRSPRAIIDLDSAVRRYDDLRAQVALRPLRPVLVATGIEGYGLRGLSGSLAIGPVAAATWGHSIGEFGVGDASLSTRFLSTPDAETAQVSRATSGVELHAPLGPTITTWRSRASAVALLAGARDASDLVGSSTLRQSLPLARRFDRTDGFALTHVIEPFAEATILTARTTADPSQQVNRPMGLANGARWIGVSGARTSLVGAGVTAEAEIALGAFGGFDEIKPEPAATATVSVMSDLVGLSVLEASVLDRERSAAMLSGRARLGRVRSAEVTGRVSYRTAFDPVAARALALGSNEAVGVGWLDREGTSVGLDGAVGVGRGYRTFAGADADVGRGNLVGGRGGVLYEHPCGCVTVSSWIGKRLGRDGVDAWLALNLAPQ